MKVIGRLAVAIFLICGFGHEAWAAKFRAVSSFPMGDPRPGEEFILQFSLFRENETVPLKGSELLIQHEKPLHAFMLDSGFEQYVHEHPVETSPGVWQIKATVSAAGKYRTWLQFKPQNETKTQTLSFDSEILFCPSETVPSSPVDPSVKLTVADGPYRVTASFPSGEPMQHGMTEVTFKIEKDGVELKGADLENFLGAKIHVTGISSDKEDFVHDHPGHTVVAMGSNDLDKDLTLKMHFMQEGYYGLFAQFVHDSRLVTAQFGIEVKGHSEE